MRLCLKIIKEEYTVFKILIHENQLVEFETKASNLSLELSLATGVTISSSDCREWMSVSSGYKDYQKLQAEACNLGDCDLGLSIIIFSNIDFMESLKHLLVQRCGITLESVEMVLESSILGEMGSIVCNGIRKTLQKCLSRESGIFLDINDKKVSGGASVIVLDEYSFYDPC
jgi:hypothetical protein